MGIIKQTDRNKQTDIMRDNIYTDRQTDVIREIYLYRQTDREIGK